MEYVTMTLTRHRLVSLPEPPSEELLQEEFLYNDDEPTQKLASVVKEEKKKSSWFKLLLRIAVAAVLFFFIFKSVKWADLVTTLMHANDAFLLLGLSAGLVCMVFSVYGWRSLLLGERIRTDMARLINLYMVGLAFSNFLPTSMGGDTVKVFYVGSEAGNMPGAASAGLMTRITSFTGMLLIAVPAVIILHDKLDKTIVATFLFMSLMLAIVLVGIMVFAMLLPRLSTRFLSSKWTKNKVVEMVLKVLTAMNATLMRPGTLIAGIIFGMLFWVASFLNYYGYALALGVNVPLSFYMIAIPFVSIVGALPISINGYGVQEGAFVAIFTTAHVNPSTSLLLALVLDAQVLLWSVIGGGIYLKMNFNARTNGVRNG
jgi:glycosyltransferase 2 family protein